MEKTKSRRSKQDDFLLNQSLTQLQSILHPQQDIPENIDQNRLFDACQQVGKQLQLNFKHSAQTSSTKTLDEQVHDLCVHSQIYYRKIALPEDWLKTFHSSFLGFYGESQQPIAVLYTPQQGFRAFDPETRQIFKIDSSVAKKLASEAFLFFRSLEDQKLSFRNIWNFNIWQRKKEWLLFGFIASLSFLLTALFPIFTQVVFDYVIPSRNENSLVEIALGMLILSLATLAFNYNRESILLRLSGLVDHDLTMANWQRLIQLPAQFFRNHSLYDLFIYSSAIGSIRQLLSSQVIQSFLSVGYAVILIIIMFYYSKALAVVGLVLVIMQALVILISTPFNVRYGREIVDLQILSNNRTFEIIKGLSKIILSASQTRFFHRWERVFSKLKQTELKQYRLRVVVRVLSAFLSYFGIASIFVAIIFFLKSQEPSDVFAQQTMSVGSFMGFLTAFSMLNSASQQLTQTFVKAMNVIPLWDKVQEMYKVPSEKYSEKVDPGVIQGEITIKDLSFGYTKEGTQTLSNINLHIKPGQCIALVGPSGCGKSTLIRLLLGFETPSKGSIFYDHHDMHGINLQLLRAQIGSVLQSSVIIDGTIQENINSGRFYTEKEVLETFQRLGMLSFIQSLPMGLNTLLIHGGASLSGGQRQLILLARALIGNPKILILDEATSSLDSKMQKIVFEHLGAQPVTRLIITQRLENLRGVADHILLMDKGSIIDQGTFDELSQRSKLFNELVKGTVS